METENEIVHHFIIDRSASMEDRIDAVVDLFREHMSEMNVNQERKTEPILVGLTTFSDSVIHHFVRTPLNPTMHLEDDQCFPEGGTALFDAIGLTVNELRATGLTSEHGQKISYVVEVITDGVDNASKEYSLEDIKELIRQLESTGNWKFNFIGTTLKNIRLQSIENDLGV